MATSERASRARPLGNVQRQKRDSAVEALQDGLRTLAATTSATRELNYNKLTGDGVRDRAAFIAAAHIEIKIEIYRAIMLLQAMTDDTPLDMAAILDR